MEPHWSATDLREQAERISTDHVDHRCVHVESPGVPERPEKVFVAATGDVAPPESADEPIFGT